MARDRTAQPEAKPIRLFVAADVPDSVKAGLAEDVARFRERIPGARWTGSHGWHVTLKFLGATWPRLVDTIREAVGRVAATTPPFRSSLTEIGVFPSASRARVVWAGLSDPDGRYAGIAAALDQELVEDFTPESRDFTPHLTLARLVPPRNIREFAPDLVGAPVVSEPFDVDRIVLYRSHLSPKGARYEPLEEARLLGDG